ncbi:hypothetical protein RAA17_20565 [Komagataeibacter rhaeticus]|nr:hypothetical protein [Komagataeibacter rhaeticus]
MLTSWLSWRWIFYVNIPLGLVAIVLTGRFIPQIRTTRPPPFDLKGNILSATALGADIRHGTAGAWRPGPLAGHGAAAAGPWRPWPMPATHARWRTRYWTWRCCASPPSAYRFSRAGLRASPRRAPSSCCPRCCRSALVPAPRRAGWSPSSPPWGAGHAPCGLACLPGLGFRRVMCAGSLVLPGMCVVLALLRPGMAPGWLLPVLAFNGLGQTLLFTGYNTIAYADMPPARMSAATSLYATCQQTMLTLGICLAAGVLAMAQGCCPRHGGAGLRRGLCRMRAGGGRGAAAPAAPGARCGGKRKRT